MLHRLAILACAAAIAACGQPANAETVRIGGTGGALGMLRHIAKSFADRSGDTLDVVPSLGSGGGIRATGDGAIDLSITGRTLTEQEQARGLMEVALIRTPYIFATSNPGPIAMAGRDIVQVYAEAAPSWSDGTRIKLILRPLAEDDNAVIGSMFPAMASAMQLARLRTELPIATTDQDNAELAEQLPGSFAGMTYTQLLSERRNLRAIAIDDVAPDMAAFESGRYKFGKVFHIVSRRRADGAIGRFLSFLASDEGIRAMREAGCLPVSE